MARLPDDFASYVPDLAHLSLKRLLRGLATAVRWAAFWMAILLPLVITPAVLTGRLNRRPYVFFGLIILNVVCVVAGHNHRLRDR